MREHRQFRERMEALPNREGRSSALISWRAVECYPSQPNLLISPSPKFLTLLWTEETLRTHQKYNLPIKRKQLTIREWHCCLFWGMHKKSVCATLLRTIVPVQECVFFINKTTLLAAKRRGCSRVYKSHASTQNNGRHCSALSNSK